MAVNLRVTRGDGRRVPFANPNRGGGGGGDQNLGPDVAMVGGANDQSATIEIDPSEFENNPFLGGEDENDDSWSLPKDGGGTKAKGNGAGQGEDQQNQRQNGHETDRGGQGDEGGDEDEEDVRLAYDEGSREERPSHRSRRNASRRRAIDQRDSTIQELRQQLENTHRMVVGLYGGQFNLSARDVEQRLTQNQSALERADLEMARAIKESDGDAFAIVQRERDKIYREIFQLQQAKGQLETYARQMQEGGTVDPRQRGEQPPTPEQQRELVRQNGEYERMRDVFLDRYTWFDPEGSNDRDHRVVKRIDRELVAEGMQPHTVEFWHEFEARMKDEGYRPDGQEQEQEQEQDNDRGRRRNTGGRQMDRGSFDRGGRPVQRRSGPPTGAVRSTRRPGNQDGAIGLSEIQMDLLRDEGLDGNDLSEKEQEKKDRIINKWARGAAAFNNSRR